MKKFIFSLVVALLPSFLLAYPAPKFKKELVGPFDVEEIFWDKQNQQLVIIQGIECGCGGQMAYYIGENGERIYYCILAECPQIECQCPESNLEKIHRPHE